MKSTTVWAIRLSSNLVELRATEGKAEIIRSVMKKKVPHKRYNYNTGQMDDYHLNTTFKQTFMVGGRFIRVRTLEYLRGKLGSMDFGDEEIMKLSPAQAKMVLDPLWRKVNL